MKNVGNGDRIARVVGSALLVGAAFFAPLPAAVALPVFLGLAGYMLATALIGTCLGYKMMGMSTCPNKRLA